MHFRDLKRPVLSALAFFWTLAAFSFGYSAYVTNMPATVSTGSGLSASEWNKMVTALQTLDGKLSAFGISAANNVGIGVPSPLATLDVNGDFIRTIPRWQGYSADQTDNGVLAGRTLTMTKRYASTGIKVTWNDNFRVTGNNTACSWEILFNGVSCPTPWALRFDKYEGGTSSNRHDPNTVFGTCFWLPAGNVIVTTKVSQMSGFPVGGDCSTGWNGGLVSIEGEEVR